MDAVLIIALSSAGGLARNLNLEIRLRKIVMSASMKMVHTHRRRSRIHVQAFQLKASEWNGRSTSEV